MLATLRDATPNNRRFGRLVREQFDLHNSLEVAEMMRIARLYGERPEIYSNVSWHALVELATSATSEAGAKSSRPGSWPASVSMAPKSYGLAPQLEFARRGRLRPDVRGGGSWQARSLTRYLD
jgi:hypothetical protein